MPGPPRHHEQQSRHQAAIDGHPDGNRREHALQSQIELLDGKPAGEDRRESMRTTPATTGTAMRPAPWLAK